MLLAATRPRVGSQTPAGATLDLDFRTFRALVGGVRRPFAGLLNFSRASAARCIGPGGVMTSYAADVARIAYSASGSPRGLLIEGAAANLIKHSNDFSNAVWNKTTGASAVFGVAGPDGAMSASRLTDTQATGATPGSFWQAVTVANDNFASGFSFSIFPGTRSILKLDISFAGGLAVYGNATFDFKLGRIVETQGVVGARITRGPFGSFRISIWMYNNASGNTTFYASIYRSVLDDVPGYFDAWGAQIENSDACSSPIVTGAAAGTRAGDLASLSLDGASWFNPLEGTFYADVEVDGGTGSDQTFFVARTGFNDYIWGRRAAPFAINALVTTGGVSQAALTMYGADLSPARYRLAMSYGANKFAGACAGGSAMYADLPAANFPVETDSAGTVPSGLATLDLGQFAGISPLNGVLGRLIYFPRALNDDEKSALVA